MPRHTGPLLVDTNVIIECWRLSAWNALCGAYRVETVEDCVIETQTGFQNRRAEQAIDSGLLRARLAVPPHPVTDRQRAELALREPRIQLDPGESSLWAHALGRADAWALSGPDRASLRMGVRLGFRERLLSLEAVLSEAGFRPRAPFKRNYSAAWHAQVLNELAVMESTAPVARS
jgi:hypothetical protein